MKTETINLELLEKYFNNECTPEEQDIVLRFLNDTSKDFSIRQILQEYWNIICEDDIESGLDTETIINKIHHRINLLSYKKNKLQQSGKETMSRRLLTAFYRVAAILFIPLLILSLYKISQDVRLSKELKESLFTEFYSPNGSKTKIDLPDGSSVWLNGGSWIKYPQTFSGKDREVYFSGEAFFNIKKDEKNPFVVNTEKIDVKVLGTRFNLNAYRDDESVSTTLVSGKVELYKDEEGEAPQKIAELKPSENFTFNKQSNTFSVKALNSTDKYTAWINGKIIFEDDQISDVLNKLERWYNVEIQYNKDSIDDFGFTATFSDETLPQVLELISLAIPVEYTLIDANRKPDNSFSKKVYKIKMRENFDRNY